MYWYVKKKKKKKLQRNFNELEAEKEKGEKKSLGLVVCPFRLHPPSKSLYTTRKMKTFWFLTNSAIEAAITEKIRENFIFFFFYYFNALLIRLARFSWAPLWGQSSGQQHCPIQSTKGRYFHWSMSVHTKQIEIDNTLQQNPTVN